ncbi:hypothetical protein FC093_12885 [Ilyomonas limi]|uniref:Uncharacterized protein n=1 Tax=Ilyomonas limi TaxID=2575867 RepID=A0A4U3L0H5_9BACT|nr:hypothetical protein [Ilyomonas limi]TKK67644.1 hypothetical protein FC093_12885 [Ilyomonas limi]
MNTKLFHAYLNAKQKFIQYDGVLGVDYGSKISGGTVTNREAIIVFVERKLTSESAKGDQLISQLFEGFVTDVRMPKLNMTETEKFNPNKPPDNNEDKCLFDYNWIDFGKIHALNLICYRQRNKNVKGIGDLEDVPTVQTLN